MKKILIIFLAIVIKAHSQDYENKALLFFIQNKHEFLVNDSDLIYLEPVSHRDLPLSLFYNKFSWKQDSMIKLDLYNSTDSLLNSKTKNQYNLSHKESFIQNDTLFYQNPLTKKKQLRIFKRYYYNGFVYVLVVLYEHFEDFRNYIFCLIKYDYKGNIIKYSIDAANT